jgi:hypothetical protein
MGAFTGGNTVSYPHAGSGPAPGRDGQDDDQCGRHQHGKPVQEGGRPAEDDLDSEGADQRPDPALCPGREEPLRRPAAAAGTSSQPRASATAATPTASQVPLEGRLARRVKPAANAAVSITSAIGVPVG